MRLFDKLKVNRLINDLNSKESLVPEKAAEALGKIGDERAIEPLIAAMAREGDGYRIGTYCSEALVQIGDPAVPALLNSLKSDDRWKRGYGVESLGFIGDKRAVEPLIQVLLHDKDQWVRREAADALGIIGDTRAVKPLIQQLSDDKDVGPTAAEALGEIGDTSAVEPLIHILKGDDRDVTLRLCAGGGLGWIGDARALKPLIEVFDSHPSGLRDKNGLYTNIVGYRAISGFGELAVEPLIQRLDDFSQRETCLWALGIIGDDRAIEPITRALKSKEPGKVLQGREINAAEWALLRINYKNEIKEMRQKVGDTKVIEYLIRFMDINHGTSDFFVAANALMKISEEIRDSKTIELLEAASKSGKREVRVAAKKALRKIKVRKS